MWKRSQQLTAHPLVLAILLLSITGVVFGQNPVVESKIENWKTFSSVEGRFSVNFPGTPAVSTEKIRVPGAEFVLNKHMLETRATYGVIYADYPTKFETEEARKQLLVNAAKGAAAEIDSELLENTETTVQGNPARELKEKLKNGAIMKVKMILVDEQRLYQVAVTLPAPDKMSTDEAATFDVAAHQFLSSFKLTSTEQTLGEVDQWRRNHPGEPLYGVCLVGECDKSEKPEEGSTPVHKSTTVIADGSPMRALTLPRPAYPALARAAKVSGTVKVQVVIDENGKVIAAQAIDGHPLLYAASVAAARGATFTTPKNINGQPIKLIGVIDYNFVAQ